MTRCPVTECEGSRDTPIREHWDVATLQRVVDRYFIAKTRDGHEIVVIDSDGLHVGITSPDGKILHCYHGPAAERVLAWCEQAYADRIPLAV